MVTAYIYWIIWLHWFSDFVLQTDWMAINKSKKNLVLLAHVGMYSLPLLVWVYFGYHGRFIDGLIFVLFNACAHFLTDWVTSRITSMLWANGDRHNFFVIIGLDQAVHLTTLFLSAGHFLK